MQTLSKEAEQKVIDAVKRAVDLVDKDGLDPTAAMAKVAAHEKWAADMIRFASQAYNTGRQTAQREVSETALDKFAAFPLVDPDKVIAQIYPTVKTAEDISAEYSTAPGWHASLAARRSLDKHRAIVKAADDDSTCEICNTSPCSCEPKKTASELLYDRSRAKRAAENARHVAATTYEQMLGSMGQLRTYFKKLAMDRIPFAAAEVAAKAYYGDAGQNLMDWVYTQNRMKEARCTEKIAYFGAVDENIEPYNLISRCIHLARSVNEKRAAHAQAVVILEKAGQALNPFVLRPVSPYNWSLIPEKQGTGIPAWAGGAAVATGTRELLEKALRGGATRDERVSDMIGELDDPQHDSELRKIRTQAMLSDMMNDEVIGGYDPDHVMRAYNEISQMAPRASGQPVAVRSLLRRHLQGNVEPFEARELAGLEKDMTQAPPQPAGGTGKRIMNDGKQSILG